MVVALPCFGAIDAREEWRETRGRARNAKDFFGERFSEPCDRNGTLRVLGLLTRRGEKYEEISLSIHFLTMQLQ